MKNKTYKFEYFCYNCGKRFEARIQYGKPVPESVICPNCECDSLTIAERKIK